MVAISALRAVLIAALWQLALPSTLSFTGSQGASASYTGRPAAWNAYLPNFGNPKLSYTTPLDRESYKVQPQFYGRVVLDPGSVGDPRSLGCAPMPATVKVEALAVLLERGLCSFREKALNAFNAGYSAVLISNTLEGDAKVPDMTSGTESQDRLVELSAWAVPKETGDALRTWLSTDNSLRLEVVDGFPLKSHLGPFQEDAQGLRNVFSI